MEFAVVDCADRSFEVVCAELAEPASALQAAADRLPAPLTVHVSSLAVVGPEMAVVRADWRDGAGLLWLETELRIVGVNRGAEPTTELLLMGRSAPTTTARTGAAAWARTLLAELADHPDRRGVRPDRPRPDQASVR